MSFASALRDSAAAAPPPAADVFDISGKSVCVVDANALFKGVRPDRLADVAVTCAEVLAEVRDAASRAALAALPFGLAVRCAEPEHFAAVRRFARLTGDIGALSRPDIALLALARSLEVRQHGAGRLKDAPAPPRARPRRKAALATPTPLPGWDFVTDTEGWAALEAAEAAAEAAAAAAASPAHAAAPPPPPHHAAQTQQHAGSRVDASPKALQPAVADAHEGGDAKEEEGSSSEGDEGGGEWEAAVSRTVRVRRAKRASRAAEEASARAAAAEAAAAHRAALGLAGDAASDEAETEEEEEEEESEEEAGASDAAAAADDANPSTVCLVTADFPMQNVALQMGLRIVAPDGLRVKTLGCWAARCDACKGVTRDTQRHFCGRCGNAAMRKVQLLVDAHGVEQVGSSKRAWLDPTHIPLFGPFLSRYYPITIPLPPPPPPLQATRGCGARATRCPRPWAGGAPRTRCFGRTSCSAPASRRGATRGPKTGGTCSPPSSVLTRCSSAKGSGAGGRGRRCCARPARPSSARSGTPTSGGTGSATGGGEWRGLLWSVSCCERRAVILIVGLARSHRHAAPLLHHLRGDPQAAGMLFQL